MKGTDECPPVLSYRSGHTVYSKIGGSFLKTTLWDPWGYLNSSPTPAGGKPLHVVIPHHLCSSAAAPGSHHLPQHHDGLARCLSAVSAQGHQFVAVPQLWQGDARALDATSCHGPQAHGSWRVMGHGGSWGSSVDAKGTRMSWTSCLRFINSGSKTSVVALGGDKGLRRARTDCLGTCCYWYTARAGGDYLGNRTSECCDSESFF